MKNLTILLIISAFLIALSCNKETQSEKFLMLTGPAWTSDSLLVDGIDASGPGQMLNKFVGNIKFREDGSGNFGMYSGKWRFAFSETEIVIESDSLPVPLTTKINELTSKSLKLTTSYPNLLNLSNPFDIRMTFKAK
jgi:hypothetical protein